MPIELTIYELADRLGIKIKPAMKLYHEDNFPNAVPNRRAIQVRIPVGDVEAYERRRDGVKELTESDRLDKVIDVGNKIQTIATLQDAIMARKCGYGDDVTGFLRDEQLLISEKRRLAVIDSEQKETRRLQELTQYRLDQIRDELEQSRAELNQVEAREQAVEAREQAVERAENNNSRISTDNYKMGEKVRIMTQGIYHLHKDIIEYYSLNGGWLSPNKRRIPELKKSILDRIGRLLQIYSDGHGLPIDQEGNIK